MFIDHTKIGIIVFKKSLLRQINGFMVKIVCFNAPHEQTFPNILCILYATRLFKLI